ncbi:rCG62178 [Rattus norvegicus]|uniref:RCG62178 n=1 Tax=Rattus norvegicus TaxID=10116 RepID=A6HCC1_RAT|nr:rCG62178 [Rattus norvegicus]
MRAAQPRNLRLFLQVVLFRAQCTLRRHWETEAFPQYCPLAFLPPISFSSLKALGESTGGSKSGVGARPSSQNDGIFLNPSGGCLRRCEGPRASSV